MSAFPIPSELFGYKVIDRVGEGAASTVYAVVDKGMQIRALKHVIRRTEKDQRFIDQIKQEYDIGSKLSHVNIRAIMKFVKNQKSVLGIGTGPVSDAALVMEMIDSSTLESDHRPSAAKIARYFAQAARGLAHMHERGFVHADMKPSNMMVNDDGTVKIIDLGQACPIGTEKKNVQGTPGYIAPEQAYKEAIVPATDIYNLGATLYWVLVRGNIPCALPAGETKLEMRVPVEKIRLPRPLHETDSRVPPDFTELVLGCVQPRVSDRIQSMAVIAEHLDSIAERCERSGAGRALEGPAGMGTAPDRRLDSQSTKG
jgi:serine/threonine-protein kinase